MAIYFSTDISSYISRPGTIQKITVKPVAYNNNALKTRKATLRISVPGYEDKLVRLYQTPPNTIG